MSNFIDESRNEVSALLKQALSWASVEEIARWCNASTKTVYRWYGKKVEAKFSNYLALKSFVDAKGDASRL